MNLGLDVQHFTSIIDGECTSEEKCLVNAIAYDTRKISDTEGVVFFALKTSMRDGHTFIKKAYDLGVRMFVVENDVVPELEAAIYIRVNNTYDALYELAKYKRKQFEGEVVLISGIYGKTIVKEWTYHLLSHKKNVARSPKSYNSSLGVPLSILESRDSADVLLIEVKPHSELDPVKINELVAPTIGVWTSKKGIENTLINDPYVFALYQGVEQLISRRDDSKWKHHFGPSLKGVDLIPTSFFTSEKDELYLENASTAHAIASLLLTNDAKDERLQNLPPIALRMETYEGVSNTVVINDTYNFDIDALPFSLEYQQTIANDKKRIVLIALTKEEQQLEEVISAAISTFRPDKIQFIYDEKEGVKLEENAVVLVKGTRTSCAKKIAQKLKKHNHKTLVKIDVKALRKNVMAYKSMLPAKTKMMAMVKASSYGSGLEEMAQFLDPLGIDYFGVAYADEGVSIRSTGITKPIMVMNSEEENFDNCIQHQLEPAIYDFEQLDAFIRACILNGVENYPIHLKFDTGMRRLGFQISEREQIIEVLQAQPEVKVKSVYSHLADADNIRDRRFTEHQLKEFTRVVRFFKQELSYGFESHILNSAGMAIYHDHPFSMVRLGIGMYGISPSPPIKRRLQPVLSWYSVVSQIREVAPGQSVGYSRSHVGTQKQLIATIPVGYADGFKRSLSNGVGYVFIQGKKCPIVGRVCMDMIMVDVTDAKAKIGDEVEIIGPNISLETMAELQNTIPYEVMTSISKRVHRLYID